MSINTQQTPISVIGKQSQSIKIVENKVQFSNANDFSETNTKLSINQNINLANSIKTRTMISGLNAWDINEEEHKFGAELRQKNVLVNMIQILNDFRKRYDREIFCEDPVLKVVAKDYSSYLLNYSHSAIKLAEFTGFYDYHRVVTCFHSKTDIFIDNQENLSRAKFTQNLELALSSILQSKDDALGLLSTSHNSIGVGYAIADECISLVILTYQSTVEFDRIKNNAIGQLIFKGKLKLNDIHIEKISAIDNYSHRVIKVMTKNSIKNRKNGVFELVMDPDFDYVMEKSIIQNEKANYGRVTNKGFLIEFLIQDGSPILTLEDDEVESKENEYSFDQLDNQSDFEHKNPHKSISQIEGISIKIPLMNFPSSGDKNFQMLFMRLRKIIQDRDLKFWENLNLNTLNSFQDNNNLKLNDKSINHDLNDPMISSSESNSYSSFEDDSLSDEYDNFPISSSENNQEQKSVKEELSNAIREGREEIRKQREINKGLGERAYKVQMRRIRLNKSNLEDLSVSQIKYQATLDHIHKVRQQMKQCKEQFSKTTSVLNRNLEEKMSAFNDLRRCFISLKNEISSKAVFSSNYKKLSPQLISDLEKAEEDANGRLQHARMQVLRLKVDLDRQESEFKKKQKFENGLHLIDFEKLKIENQNLNEKMEGKNEELVKLHKKKENTVQILAHTKKKLEYEKDILMEKKLEFDQESRLVVCVVIRR